MYTKIYTGEEARQLVAKGAKILSDSVKDAFGPTSGNVGILRQLSGLDVTHDGGTVAESIKLKGPERAGVEVIQRVVQKMNKDLGDGRSTATILSAEIINAVQDNLALGDSPIELRDQLKRESIEALSHLAPLVKEVPSLEVLKQVAATSAADEKLGHMVAEAAYEVGAYGAVQVEESIKAEDSVTITNGYKFDNGLASPFMIRDAVTRGAVLNDPHVVVVNEKIDGLDKLAPIIKSKLQGPILVIANDFSEAVVGVVCRYNNEKMTNITFVKSPRFGEKRLEYLEDIAAVVGTKVIHKDVGFDTTVGKAGKVVITPEGTTIYEGAGDISVRLELLNDRKDAETDDFEKDELIDRIAQINGKIATVYIGGISSDEAKEKLYHAKDAVKAVQAAMKSGVVAGGGTTLIDLADKLADGAILKRVLYKPAEALLDNVDLKLSDYKLGAGKGVDLRTGEEVDLFKAGIIEAADTVKSAIESAVSIAGNAITMKRIIEEVYEEEENE